MTDKVKEIYGENVTMRVIHVLFHWNAHSFFTYHTDTDGDVSAIVNLAHCKSTMHVAGCHEAEYQGIGAANIFPSNVYHRSGDAPRRCVKIAIFFDRNEKIDVDSEKPDADAPNVKGSEETSGSTSTDAVKSDEPPPTARGPRAGT